MFGPGMTTPRRVRTVTDPAVLAALAHPTRRRLTDVLKTTETATVGMLADRLSVAVGSASHHLKVLARAGLVEPADPGTTDRRERWWRLVDAAIRWSGTDFDDGPVTGAVGAAANSLGLQRQVELARRSLATPPETPVAPGVRVRPRFPGPAVITADGAAAAAPTAARPRLAGNRRRPAGRPGW